jgi:hypothetical protein
MGDICSVLTPLAVGKLHADVHGGVVSLTGRIRDRTAAHCCATWCGGCPASPTSARTCTSTNPR